MCMSLSLAVRQKSGLSRSVWPMAGDTKIMSLTTLNESSKSATGSLSAHGNANKLSGTITKVKITIDEEFRPVVPVLIPDLDAVRTFAQQLHQRNEAWQGEVFGWEAEYSPSRPESPPHSNMPFTPAEFWLGDATIWGFSLMWEHGDDQPPVETVSDGNVIAVLQSA